MEQKDIRNFAIIAHVDHGKSTLSDRMLELTGTVAKEKLKEQFLDQNPISRERGITIKLAPVRMQWQGTILNLIDTPGHVDFSYEVSRTLAACEGAILLVDATQGVQAQTVAHLHEARKQNLTIIPVINKIDMPSADPDRIAQILTELFGFKKEEMLFVSAKTGVGVEELLNAVVSRIPAPSGKRDASLRALIFDAVYDEHRGVIAQVRIVDGSLKKGEKLLLLQTQTKAEALEVGYFTPFLTPSPKLSTGEIGYIVTGMKDIRQVRVGDTITSDLAFRNKEEEILPLPGYTTPQPMVFFGMYPQAASQLHLLRDALSKLMLSDSSLSYSEEHSNFLGTGFRVGFLGLLHAEIVRERLIQEFGIEPLLTLPHVLYQETQDGVLTEPYILLSVYVPSDYVGNVMTLLSKRKGNLLDMSYQSNSSVLSYELPYTMLVRGLSSDLKSASSGFASFDYEVLEYREADLVTVEIKINDVAIDVLSERVYQDEAEYMARQKAEKLKETLPRTQFRQIIQGVVNNRIVAREEITPYRKDVLAKMSGGDRTRKDKLLEAQKKGKKRLHTFGKVDLPQEALMSLIKKS